MNIITYQLSPDVRRFVGVACAKLKNFKGMKSTPRLITRDHDPRRTDQCNLHTHVIANKNKSPR